MIRSLIGRFGRNQKFRAKGIFVRNLSHGHQSDLHRVVGYQPFGGEVQYISDIHLDYWCWKDVAAPEVKAVAPYLVIAGDIGQISSSIYLEFLQNVCREFERVLLVPGNHEYYDHEIEETEMILDHFQDLFENLEVLNNQMTSLSLSDGRELTVMGSTLWSAGPTFGSHGQKIGKQDLKKIQILEQKMADYQRIFIQDRYLTVEDTDRFLAESVAWLWSNCHQSDQHNPLLVVTHHAPLIEQCCHPKFIPFSRKLGEIDRMKWCNYSFASDLSPLIKFIRPTAWIFGHTHYQTAFQYKCQEDLLNSSESISIVASNPIGRLPGTGVTKLFDHAHLRVL